MSRTFNRHMKSIPILSLVFIFVLSAAWAATTYYSASDVIGDAGGSFQINSKAKIVIEDGALSAYLDEQQSNEVLITADLEEITDAAGNVDALIFTFGPSGAHFEPELELRLIKNYAVQNMQMYNEFGEAISYIEKGSGAKVSFLIHHFSVYSYDHYDY